MNFRMKCEKPGEIEFTVTATMTADEWESIRDQLVQKMTEWPTIKFVGALNDVLSQARKIYWPEHPSAGDKRGD